MLSTNIIIPSHRAKVTVYVTTAESVGVKSANFSIFFSKRAKTLFLFLESSNKSRQNIKGFNAF